jgi:hypothetical protein
MVFWVSYIEASRTSDYEVSYLNYVEGFFLEWGMKEIES